jgi:NTP pyrophosphatase (non-canonical NTP hydrolase)
MHRATLDEMYRMTAYIYSEQNAVRPVAATLAHFVEVCGMLTIHDRRKKKEGLDFVDALCKSLAWYFPLLAKLRTRSVEEVVFRKYPLVCPYCRKAPHEDRVCKTVKGTESTVNHASLRRLYDENEKRRPRSLDGWQQMFQDIYPRSTDDKARSTLGLFEELGELAEAVRVFERYPKYFAGEAADTFSYLMGIANEYSLRLAQESGETFSLEEEYLKRYPGLCTGCGHRICVCPSIPPSTVGRLSKELDIGSNERLFDLSDDILMSEGKLAGEAVLQSLGGFRKLAERFPADRGDANSAIIVLLLKLAAGVETNQPGLADRFHSAAIELGTSVSNPGVRAGEGYFSTHRPLMEALREALRSLRDSDGSSLLKAGLEGNSLAFNLGIALARVRMLIVSASPANEEELRVSAEVRAILEALRISGREGDFEVDVLPAATIDDLRRALMSKDYEIVHFAGHASAESIVLENIDGSSAEVPLDAVSELFGRYESVRCVVLNGCSSAADLANAIAPYTVGMMVAVTDEAAIEFARGFYDAIARGKNIEFAVEEGRGAAKLKSLEVPEIRLLKK